MLPAHNVAAIKTTYRTAAILGSWHIASSIRLEKRPRGSQRALLVDAESRGGGVQLTLQRLRIQAEEAARCPDRVKGSELIITEADVLARRRKAEPRKPIDSGRPLA